MTDKIKNGITELVFVIDKSGSMAGLEADTIGGFNAMIEKQKKVDGRCYVSTVLFSTKSSVLHDRADIQEIAPIGEADYRVGGGTALLDAIGSTICHISDIHKYARHEDVPEHTIFVITTDGMENSSREYDRETLRGMITAKESKEGWEFIFLGANIDAVEEAGLIGIRRERAANYRFDSEGTRNMYKTTECMIDHMRASKMSRHDVSWKKILDNDEENK